MLAAQVNDDVIQGIQAMVTTEEFTSVVSLFGSYSGSSNSSGCLADREKCPALQQFCFKKPATYQWSSQSC